MYKTQQTHTHTHTNHINHIITTYIHNTKKMASKYDIQGIACARSGGYIQRDKETKRSMKYILRTIYIENDTHQKKKKCDMYFQYHQRDQLFKIQTHKHGI